MPVKTKFIRALIVLFFSLTWAGAALGQASFYQGKTIRLVVGYLSGDTHDLWARAYARHMGKHIPGNPNFVVQNMPGAGSMVAANHVYNIAKPDGLTLGSIAPGLYLAQLTHTAEVKFDWAKYSWIGTPEHNGTLLFMRADAPFKSIEDIRKAKEGPKCSATGVGTSGHLIPRLLEETLNLKFQIVTGYPGGAEQDLALERGEVQCRAITVAAFWPRAVLELAQEGRCENSDSNLAQAPSEDSRGADALGIYGKRKSGRRESPPGGGRAGLGRFWFVADRFHAGFTAGSPENLARRLRQNSAGA